MDILQFQLNVIVVKGSLNIGSDGLVIENPLIMEKVEFVSIMWGPSDVVVYGPTFLNAILDSGRYPILKLSIQRSTILIKKDSSLGGIWVMVHPPS